MRKRTSGILLPISSLPSPYGIGCFSREAYQFIDDLVEAGQSYWQILPVGPTGYGDSPYQSFSTFAGNPYFIDLTALIEEGVLTKKECEAADFGTHKGYVDYGRQYESRYPLLRRAYERSDITKDAEFLAFQKENAWWLKDYALFMAVKKCFGDVSWDNWAEDIRKRYGYSLDYYRRTCYFEIEFQEYMQYKFWQQWKKLKAYANEKGIRFIGDLPIYVAYDSADVWSCPRLFQLDEEGRPKQVAGCPPDAFSEGGQLWGNPLYDWDYHAQTDYAWWKKRFAHAAQLFDIVRIDHFRGFDEYYAIPAEDEDAKQGKWKKGPGRALFDAIRREQGEVPVLAEDLGQITPSVKKLVRDCGFPNMKVLQFAFDGKGESDHMPHNASPLSVFYTGTHDNATLLTYCRELTRAQKRMISEYLELSFEELEVNEQLRLLLRVAMYSVSEICMIPMQDYLELSEEARMNEPSTLGNNWKWRMGKRDFTRKRKKRIYELTKKSYRLPEKKEEET